MKLNKESGQVIVILLLVMLVVLSVVLAITQRSTTDLSSSTETEQSTRAYSAAEAGLEKALQRGGTSPSSAPITSQTINLPGNQSSATIRNSGYLPVKGSGVAIEYPPIGKESVAQFWLTDPADATNNYNRNSFYIYFGNPVDAAKPATSYDDTTTAKNISPAIEVNVVKQIIAGTTTYESQRTYYDSLSSRASSNNFVNITTPSSPITCSASPSVTTILKTSSQFYCRVLVNIVNCALPSCVPQLVRVRLLYANLNHKIAIAPNTGSFPPQVELYTSTGKAGQSQKTLQVYRVKEMLPPWLDFAIFSVNDIVK